MVSLVLQIILIVELIVTTFILFHTVQRIKTEKKVYFVFYLCLIFLYLIGYLLETTSISLDGAFSGLKVEYIGTSFVSTFFLLFILDCCEVKLRRYHLALLLLIPCITLVLVWLSRITDIYYASLSLSTEGGIFQTASTPGPWYFVYYGYFLTVAIAAAVVCGLNLNRFDKEVKRRLGSLLKITVFTLLVHLTYVAGFNILNIYYPVIVMGIAVVFMFRFLVCYDVYDIFSKTNELAIESMTEGFILFDSQMKYLNSNNAANKLFPILESADKGQRVDNMEGWPRELWDLHKIKERSAEIDFSIKNDSAVSHYSAGISRIFSVTDDFLGIVLLIKDVTDTKNFMARMEAISYTDSLTGALNRHRFTFLAEKEFEASALTSHPFSVIIVDMDRYKKINEAYGHSVGDSLLRFVAECIQGIAPQDVLFARFGGEEFILLAHMGIEGATKLAERIKNEIAYSVFENDGNIVRCTVSAGVSSGTPYDTSLDRLIKYSERALKKAKVNGRNRVEAHVHE